MKVKIYIKLFKCVIHIVQRIFEDELKETIMINSDEAVHG
jgi:hypothetical protein